MTTTKLWSRPKTACNMGFAARLADVVTINIYATIIFSLGRRNSNRHLVLTSTLNHFTSFRTGLTEHIP